MKRMIGNLLVVASVLLMAITVVWMVVEVATSPGDPNEDQRSSLIAGVLFSGVLIALEIVVLLTGRWLRRPLPVAESRDGTPRRAVGRPGALAVYLAGSAAVALLANLLRTAPESLRVLWLLIGQPSIFTQLFLGGLLGVKLNPGAGTQAIVIVANLLYVLVLFYPVYRLLTMNRAAEATRVRRMKVLLALFGSVHLLLAGAFAMLIRA